MADVSEVKIKALYDVLYSIPEFISDLCAIKKDVFVVKQAEWEDTVRKIKTEFESEQMLLFIGPFSSGKSTFVNALLGEALLPVADKPCTSVVTELSFKEGGGHKGRIVGLDKSVKEEDYEELVKIIDGAEGPGPVGQLAEIHHIELLFDVTKLEDWENHPLSQLMRLDVKVVDCPGFGAPYIINDKVIYDYVQRASHTFWMSPANRFGGMETVHRLKEIKKKTTTIIPVITKADIIDNEERERVSEYFLEHLKNLFTSESPRFTSAIKWKKAMELAKSLYPVNPNKEMTKEEQEKTKKEIDILKRDSGLEQIFHDMVLSGQRPEVTEKKLEAALFDLSGLLKDMSNRAGKEANYWLKEAERLGFSEDERYTKLNDIKRRVNQWIKQESKEVADNLENAMVDELTEYIMDTNGKVESGRVTEITANLWEQELNKRKGGWEEHLYWEYKEYADEYSVNFPDDKRFKAPELQKIGAGLGHIIKGFLDALRYGGPQSVLMCGAGAALFAALPSISGVAIIGSALATAAGIASGALILVAAVPLLPVILDRIKNQKEKYRKEMESKLREWMKKLNLAPSVQTMLNEANERLYESYKVSYDTNLKPIVSNLSRSKEIKEEISKMEEKISDTFKK